MNNTTISVTLEIDRQGNVTRAFPCVQNDEELKIVRRALDRLIRPGFAGLLRRFLDFGARAEK